MAKDENPDTESYEEDETKVVTYVTPTGQQITLSKEALNVYGEDYINQLAASAGKTRLLLADEIVLEDAKERFPNSETPLIDAYADYTADADDFLSTIYKKNPGFQASIDEENKFRQLVNSELNDGIQFSIKENNAQSISDPMKDAAIIVIPAPYSLEDDEYKEKITSGLSGLDSDRLSGIPGNSIDWAKFVLTHEIAHLNNNDSGSEYEKLMNTFLNKNQPAITNQIDSFHKNLTEEIRADGSAVRAFNSAAGVKPLLLQAWIDVRTVGSVKEGGDIITMGGTGSGLNDHDTGNALQNFLEKGTTDFDINKEQFTSCYTNTLIRGFIGVAKGESVTERTYYFNNFGNPIYSTTNNYIDRQGFLSARAGNDPTNLVSYGSSVASDTDIYAATKILLENGQFDHAPEAKIKAERFIASAERIAPAIIDPEKIDFYTQAIKDPANQNFMNELHRYYNPELTIGYLYGSAASNSSRPVPTPAPIQ